VRVGVRVNDPEKLSEVIERLPPGWKPAGSLVVDQLFSVRFGGESRRPGVKPYHLLYSGFARTARTLSERELLEQLETDLQLFVGAEAPRRIFVHAGVVEWRGRAIVIPGSTFSGKSSLVAALVRAGATYYSDEFTVLDARGRVHPYPRPINLRTQEGEPGMRCTAEELGGRTGRKAVPVGLVVVTEYREGARWRPRELTPGHATLALLAHTVPARRQPARAMSVLKQVAAGAKTLKSARGDADDLAKTLLLTIDRILAREAGDGNDSLLRAS